MRRLAVIVLTLIFLVGIATSAYAASQNTGVDTMGAGDYNPYPAYEFEPGWGDMSDNNLDYYNANSSGKGTNINDGTAVDEVIKSDGMRDTATSATDSVQRTHGEYKNNTNSCASCHQTHTGAAKDLLIKDSVFTTCTACHDGTLGFYNVFTESTAGTFGGTAEGNASIHMADGSFEQKYAPGGNLYLSGTDNGGWTEMFDCASCHAPHGSYSDRLLHYNPNNMANTPIENGGQKLVNAPVYDFASIPDASLEGAAEFIMVRGTALELGVTQEADATPVIALMKDSGDTYVRDTTPWLYGYDFDANHNKLYYSAFFDSAAAEMHLVINYGKAYAISGDTDDIVNAVTANIGRVYVTKLGNATYPITYVANAGNYPVYKVNPLVYDQSGIGTSIGKYCGTCHTDYRASSGAETGMYTMAFRHTTDNDRYTCLKCHFAHGTDVTVMMDAKDNTVQSLVDGGAVLADAKAFMLDKNPSSALKRYTNMAVCWKCHTSSKASQLKQNDYYWDNWNSAGTGSVPEGF